jgi:hypothetical protein
VSFLARDGRGVDRREGVEGRGDGEGLGGGLRLLDTCGLLGGFEALLAVVLGPARCGDLDRHLLAFLYGRKKSGAYHNIVEVDAKRNE